MNLPYPPPLMTSESFARHTVAHRLPSIVADVIAENEYPPQVTAALQDLRDEIAHRAVAPLTEDAPDVAAWRRAWAPYRGRTWLDVPWYLAESYFYRRLLEASRYFQPGDGQGCDPFEARKRRALEDKAIVRLPSELAAGCQDEREGFVTLLHASLWGNRADLSNIVLAARPEDDLGRSSGEYLLVDHSAAAWALVASGRLGRVDFVCDNAGLETLLDLALTDFLLVRKLCRQIVFHLKARPFFVSDTMIKDVSPMLLALRQAGGAATALAARLERWRRDGQWVLRDDPFWTSWLGFREMPAHLRDALAGSDLVILKGDLNYRRLLDDRRWPPTTRLEDVTGYFPASFLTLRTLKAEIIVGLREGLAEALSAAEPDWLVNGRRGLIHLVKRDT
jgi:hypothetical protein